MSQIHIALDIETLSTRPTAAIISIAAKCFTFDKEPQPMPLGVFCKPVNATTCAMYHGFSFDQETIDFWAKQSDDAKRMYIQDADVAASIRHALLSLNEYYKAACNICTGQRPLIWCQGTDFDIAILRNAFRSVTGKDAPWPHNDVRDSRTFIHALAALVRPDVADPYSIIPKNPEWNPHDPLSDCDQLIWNVRHLVNEFHARMLPAGSL